MNQAAEAAAAAAGGVLSTGALFPLEVIKINLQAHVKDRTLANHTSDEEGKEGLTNKPAGAAVEEEGLRDRLTNHSGKEERGEEDTGKRSSFVGQKEEDCSPSVGSVARDIYSRDGARGFYKGVCYSSFQSGVEKAAYFYGYGWLKKLALRIGGGRELNTTTDLVLGYLAEALHLPLTIPIEVVLTKIVTSQDKTNAFAVIQGILAESGPVGFFKGIRVGAHVPHLSKRPTRKIGLTKNAYTFSRAVRY